MPEPTGDGTGVHFAAERLDSWKEVAAYLRRGARTVQRWEREQGLPVHRLQHEKLGSVYAYKSELDEWWDTRRGELETQPSAPKQGAASIAVLPFCDMSRDKDQDYFCEGIAEEITSALSGLEGLQIASRSATFRYRGGQVEAAEAGRTLHVRTLLEGSVRKAGDRLRITVRMTDTGSGYQVWSETYDAGMSDIFAVQGEVAACVRGAVKLRLGPKETARLRKMPASNMIAICRGGDAPFPGERLRARRPQGHRAAAGPAGPGGGIPARRRV